MPAPFTIRRLTAEDAPGLRALRLETLEREPEAFGSSLAEEKDLPLEHFAGSTERNAILGAFVGGRLAGMAGFYVLPKAKTHHRA